MTILYAFSFVSSFLFSAYFEWKCAPYRNFFVGYVNFRDSIINKSKTTSRLTCNNDFENIDDNNLGMYKPKMIRYAEATGGRESLRVVPSFNDVIPFSYAFSSRPFPFYSNTHQNIFIAGALVGVFPRAPTSFNGQLVVWDNVYGNRMCQSHVVAQWMEQYQIYLLRPSLVKIASPKLFNKRLRDASAMAKFIHYVAIKVIRFELDRDSAFEWNYFAGLGPRSKRNFNVDGTNYRLFSKGCRYIGGRYGSIPPSEVKE